MKPMMSSQTIGMRNELSVPLNRSRMITIVPRSGFTAAVAGIWFAIDKQMICILEPCEPRPALRRRGSRRRRYNTREIDNQGRAV